MPGAAAATSLISALNSAKTVKATTNLKQTVDGVNELQGSGALDQLQAITSNLGGLQTVFALVQIVTAELTKGTIDSTMEAFNKTLELIQSDAGKEFVNLVSGLLNFLVSNAADLIGLITYLDEKIPMLSSSLRLLNTAVGFLDSKFDQLKQSIADVVEELDNQLAMEQELIEARKNETERMRIQREVLADMVPGGTTGESETPLTDRFENLLENFNTAGFL